MARLAAGRPAAKEMMEIFNDCRKYCVNKFDELITNGNYALGEGDYKLFAINISTAKSIY